MKKVKKSYSNFYLRDTTTKELDDFIDENDCWNKSVFVDVAIQEKLEKEKKK